MSSIRRVIKWSKRLTKTIEVTYRVRTTSPLRVIVGAANTRYPGWVHTDATTLDIRRPRDWRRFFRQASIDRILSEHVLEHLTEAEARTALALSLQYLRPGGVLRLAVPDGYRHDEVYVKEVQPPRAGHQQLLNIDSLTEMLRSVGFDVLPLEFFDADGIFHAADWDPADGLIQRSLPFDRQTDFRRGDLYYTSLIVDATRPIMRA